MKDIRKLRIVFLLLALVIFSVISSVGSRPSFVVIKGNNPPVEYCSELLKININTADADELCELVGIGEKMAENIITYREQIGGFTDISQLLEVKGIGEKKLEAIKDFILIG